MLHNNGLCGDIDRINYFTQYFQLVRDGKKHACVPDQGSK